MTLRPRTFILTRLSIVSVGVVAIGTICVSATDRPDVQVVGIGMFIIAAAAVLWAIRLKLSVDSDNVTVIGFARRRCWTWPEVAAFDIGGTSALTPYHLYPVLVVIDRQGRRTRVGATLLQSEATMRSLWSLLAKQAETHGVQMFNIDRWLTVGDLDEAARESAQEWREQQSVYRRLREVPRRRSRP